MRLNDDELLGGRLVHMIVVWNDSFSTVVIPSLSTLRVSCYSLFFRDKILKTFENTGASCVLLSKCCQLIDRAM